MRVLALCTASTSTRVAGDLWSWLHALQSTVRGADELDLVCHAAVGRLGAHLILVPAPPRDDGARAGQALNTLIRIR